MTFQDLVENLGLSAGGLRVLFCQKKWSIHSPEDVRKFLATRFSGQKRRRKTRLPEAANHLRKWRFVKKVRRAENMEHETHNLEQNENEKMAAEKIKILEEKLARLKNENSAAAEKLKIAEEKLAAAEAELKGGKLKVEGGNIEKETRRGRACPPLAPAELTPEISRGTLPENEPPNSLTHHFSGGEPPALSTETPEIKPEKESLNSDLSDSTDFSDSHLQAPPENSPQRNLRNHNNQRNPGSDRVETPAPDFGTVPSAEERRAAARARLETRNMEHKTREKNRSGQKSLPLELTEKDKPENTEMPEKEPPNSLTHHFSGGEPPALSTETPEIKPEKESLNSDLSDSTDFSDSHLQAPPENSPQRNLRNHNNQRNPGSDRVEIPSTEIAALRAEIREQIGKIEIKEIATAEVFEEIPNEVGDENFRPAVPAEKIKPEPPTPEPEPPTTLEEIPETPEIKAETSAENLETTPTEIEIPIAETVVEPVEAEIVEEIPTGM